MSRVSFCVHSYNEADALQRLVLSSLPLADLFAEWVVVDHRSDDSTQQALALLRPTLEAKGIALTVEQEIRDFSADFTFADLRTQTVNACGHPVVVIHDADFVLGPGYRALLLRALARLAEPEVCAATYAVPVVWDNLSVDGDGTIRNHGRVWVHNRKPRVLRREAVHYEQTKDRGRWERLVPHDRHARIADLTLRHLPARDALVSINVKPPDRIRLRETMTTFLQDAMQGKAQGSWLENYKRGTVRQQPKYRYHSVRLTGWRLHCRALELCA